MSRLPSGIRWEVDPGRSMRTGYHVDHAAEQVTIVHEEDVEYVLERNEEMFRASDPFRRRREEWHMWARIPPGVVMKWKNEFGVDVLNPAHWEDVCRLLHDPEWSKLRTHAGNYQERPSRQYFRGSSSPQRVLDERDARAANLIGKSGKSVAKGGL